MARQSVSIRPFQSWDAQSVYEAVRESLHELPRFMPELDADLTVEEITQWIGRQPKLREGGIAHNFAIVDAAGDQFLGGCGLSEINQRHRFANLYYWIRTSRTGQGAATAATRLIAEFAFAQLGLNRVEIVVAVSNIASRRVAEKSGAVLEGTLRRRILAQGVLHDAFIFSLIPADVEWTRQSSSC